MQQPVKICHLLSSLKIGGAERFVIDLSVQQKKAGQSVTIISFGSSSDELYEAAEKAGVTIVLIKKRWYYNNICTFNILNAFDIVHIHSPVTLKATFLILPFLISSKVIYTRHGEGKYDSTIWKAIHKLTKPFISVLTFVSENGQKVFNEIHGWKNLKKTVIENGISPPTKAQPPLYGKKLRLGSVGRMVDLKKQAHLIKAWAQLDTSTKTKIELHFIGDGDCKQSLEQLALKQQPRENIFFHGFKSERSVIQELFDVLIVTSESEGLSIAILEAMAEGKAVIGTNVGGNPRLIKNHETGILYSFGDINALSEAIIIYVNEVELASKHGLKARKHIESNYSINSTMKRYNECYYE